MKMVKDLYPYTKNNVYREIFEEFDNLSDVGIYKIITGRPSRIIFMGLLPNISFYNMNIANVWGRGRGLRIQNKKLNLALFSKRSFTICVVMQPWLNRSIMIVYEQWNS